MKSEDLFSPNVCILHSYNENITYIIDGRGRNQG